jgi:hypothetical protein
MPKVLHRFFNIIIDVRRLTHESLLMARQIGYDLPEHMSMALLMGALEQPMSFIMDRLSIDESPLRLLLQIGQQVCRLLP